MATSANEPLVIPAGEFKARCLKLMNELELQRREIVITKRGKPVARLVPATRPRPLFGAMKDSVKVLGDIVGPTGETWDADA